MIGDVYIQCGDAVLDTDSDTKIGFAYKSRWLMESGAGTYRTFDLSVPVTPVNNKLFDYHEEPNMTGIRQGMQAVIMSGGVVLSGTLYLTQSGGNRYHLLFVYGYVADDFGANLNWVFDEHYEVIDKDLPTMSGTIPNFGFYSYTNGTNTGAVSPPTSLFPCANLGYIIDTMAAALGYSVVYPDPLLGRRFQADAYGLILPNMSVYDTHEIVATGSGIIGWAATVSGGGTLADAGLALGQRIYKRGVFNTSKTVYTFTALRPITVKVPAGQSIVVASGNGYDVKNGWEGSQGCEFEMETGDWFTFVSPIDHILWFGSYRWGGDLAAHPGYQTSVSLQFSTNEEVSIAGNGSVLDMALNMPDMTLKEYLNAYCLLICASWYADKQTREIRIIPYDDLLSNLSAFLDLDECRIISISSVRRYINGWAQNNKITCNSDSTTPPEKYFSRNYPCDNDYLDSERDVGKIPFNEGGWYWFTQGGHTVKRLQLDDVTVGSNGEINYRGLLTIFYENAITDGALHIQTVNDEGIGAVYGEFTRYTNTVEVSVMLPLYRFLQLSDEKAVTLRGATYVVESAQWGDGVAKLTLLSVNN